MLFMNKLFVFIVFFILAPICSANYRHYEASLEDSNWRTDGNKLQCQLVHQVPGYGEARFISKANFNQNMLFELMPLRNTAFNEGRAEVKIIAPEWQSQQVSRTLGQIDVHKGQKPLYVRDKISWQMLLALEGGLTPAVYYEGWVQQTDWVAVALSSVNFTEPYQEFNKCVSELLPYDFDDIKAANVYFNYERHGLTKETKQTLDRMIEYILIENNLDRIIISGHADKKGPARFNKWLAEARAIAVRDYFKEKGVTPNRYIVRTFGEKSPIASNAKPEGRANNRRVYIQLIAK